MLKRKDVVGAYSAIRHLEKLEEAKRIFDDRGYMHIEKLGVTITPETGRKSDVINIVMAGIDVGAMIETAIKSAQGYLRSINVEYSEDARENTKSDGPRRGTQGEHALQDVPTLATGWVVDHPDFN